VDDQEVAQTPEYYSATVLSDNYRLPLAAQIVLPETQLVLPETHFLLSETQFVLP
jgi:hypothetical protein